MKIWFDTEFIEDGKTIDLLSIGLVREDGATIYLENAEADLSKASPWVKENVLPHLGKDPSAIWSREQMRDTIDLFACCEPEFWAYYGAYDWVALCQIYGTMMDLPKDWPMFVRDVKQEADRLGIEKIPVPNPENAHDALADALWTKKAWEWLHKANERARPLSFRIGHDMTHPRPALDPAPRGCVCPPGAEQTCQSWNCGRKSHDVRIT